MKPGDTISKKTNNECPDRSSIVRSINLHINAACNYNCKFCFARNLVSEVMTPVQWMPYFEKLRSMGIVKINFAGGEPTLHPQFLELCSLAKKMGFVVSVVTNGSKIDSQMIEKMQGIVDWIGLSIDSPSNDVERSLGRQCKGIDHIQNIVEVARLAHDANIKVKLNITVVKQSWNADFTELIEAVSPERLKAFKVMKVEGQNEKTFDEHSITNDEWDAFVSKHDEIVLKNGEMMIFEGEDMMVDSYLMIDPIGWIMLNSGNKQEYLPFEKLDEGLNKVVNEEKYQERQAEYEWGSVCE